MDLVFSMATGKVCFLKDCHIFLSDPYDEVATRYGAQTGTTTKSIGGNTRDETANMGGGNTDGIHVTTKDCGSNTTSDNTTDGNIPTNEVGGNTKDGNVPTKDCGRNTIGGNTNDENANTGGGNTDGVYITTKDVGVSTNDKSANTGGENTDGNHDTKECGRNTTGGNTTDGNVITKVVGIPKAETPIRTKLVATPARRKKQNDRKFRIKRQKPSKYERKQMIN